MLRPATRAHLIQLFRNGDHGCAICRRILADLARFFDPPALLARIDGRSPDDVFCPRATELPCGHAFGRACICRWERSCRLDGDRGLPWHRPRCAPCPLCRAPVPAPWRVVRAARALEALRQEWFGCVGGARGTSPYVEMTEREVRDAVEHVLGMYDGRYGNDDDGGEGAEAPLLSVFKSDVCEYMVRTLLPEWVGEICGEVALLQGSEGSTGWVSLLGMPVLLCCWAAVHYAERSAEEDAQIITPDIEAQKEFECFMELVVGKLVLDGHAKEYRPRRGYR
ncbi:hypothetical protein B0J12DRAFT_747777 [Macrophomina phaseolina]|uniref:RING-type domain-containing protein n=1 Tax=Macrophomina phaseolina TaxID=35725 RepID=A0ABQ8FSA8_9PEZI|nr:hypothetical protein B0J12DRAFT_747777 [Macrophomina phaseolina]